MMGKYLRGLARAEIEKGHLKTGPSLLLLTVCDHVRDFTDSGAFGQLFAGERTVAKWIGKSQPTYRKWRAELIEAGLVKRIGGRPGVAARYQLFPNLAENPGAIGSEDSLNGREDSRSDNPSEQRRKPVGTIEPQENLNPSSTERKVDVGVGDLERHPFAADFGESA